MSPAVKGQALGSTRSAERFLLDPMGYFDHSLTRTMGIAPDDLAVLQREALQQRFAELRNSIPMLKRLADNEGIDRINDVADVLPLLFDHSTYKSYPASLLDKQRFSQLTTWLGKLTTIDLSAIDSSDCRSIDGWMQLLMLQTPLAVCHTSGTSGTMSFLPSTKDVFRTTINQFPIFFFQQFGEKPPAVKRPLNIPCIYPYFRRGGTAHTLVNDCIVEIIAGSEQHFHAAYPGYLSADLMLLAARRRAAIAKGQLEQLEINPELEARRAAFETQQRDMPRHMAKFFATMRTELAGQRVFMLATSNLLYTMASEGIKRGMHHIFARDSVVVTGGGGKGLVLPEGWQDPVKEFFGTDRINLIYGMSEMCGTFAMCQHGHYHCPTTVIPFILDTETGKPLPRSGTVTGRLAFYDLMPDTRWGGFISGDEVTLSWDVACPCGRTTSYLHDKIERISAKRSDEGEEKISCAGTPAAYEEALDFLNDDTAALD